MALFKRKPTTVDAEQFEDYTRPCRGVRTNNETAPTPTAYVVTMQKRIVPVSVGEWIIAEADGEHFYPIADAEFKRIYEPVQ